jgi:hypothetical protein
MAWLQCRRFAWTELQDKRAPSAIFQVELDATGRSFPLGSCASCVPPHVEGDGPPVI